MSQTLANAARTADRVWAGSTGRLVSLDAFRGATMAFMILVNTPGDGSHTYWPLRHAEWHGWTPTDVVFPSFLWIVGVAITLSLGRRLARGDSRAGLFRKAAGRAAILFVLGVLVYAYPAFDLSTQRILGVLQRIAICYLAAVAIFLTTRLRGQTVWIVSLLAVYWLLMAFVPVPGYGAGRLDVEGNFAHYIDRIVLGSHNYLWTKTWDPEGIVSTLPAIASCLLGVLGGYIVGSKRGFGERSLRMLGLGAVLLAAGLICNHWLPINKKLWTSSYSVFMAGMAMNCFAVCYWLVDVQGWRRWAKPFAIYGMNAITVFMLAGLLGRILPAIPVTTAAGRKTGLQSYLYDHLCAPFASPDTAPFLSFLASPNNASLMWALMYVVGLYLVAYVMYRRKWFLRF